MSVQFGVQVAPRTNLEIVGRTSGTKSSKNVLAELGGKNSQGTFRITRQFQRDGYIEFTGKILGVTANSDYDSKGELFLKITSVVNVREFKRNTNEKGDFLDTLTYQELDPRR